MKTLGFLLEKEFRQIVRNKAILRMMFVMPIIQLIILPFAADYQIKDVNLVVVDHDHSTFSNELIHKITASSYYKLVAYEDSYQHGLEIIEDDGGDIVLEIPFNFEKYLIKENESQLFIAVNAINGTRASLGAAYLQAIIRDYNQQVRSTLIQFPRFGPEPIIEVTSRFWYNVHMNYPLFMVPGILTLLLTMIGSFLAALNIVREKEMGTIEQINVTPIKKHYFIMGKLIPFWILSQIVLTLGLIVARVFYGISVNENLWLIYLFSGVYMLAVLGLGLLISTFSNTQQQAVLISFFLMMIFILMGGLYTSIDSMPYWAQIITWFNPVRYFVEVMRMVVIKGSGFWDISRHLLIISIFAIVLISWAIFNYRKRV